MEKGIIIVILAVTLVLGGCVTTGPYVAPAEIERAREDLMLKSLKFQFAQVHRIDKIGNRLIANAPFENKKRDYPYLGIYTKNIDRYLRKLFNLRTSHGVVVVVVSQSSPAERAGIRAGDIIVAIDNKRIGTQYDINRIVNRLSHGKTARVAIIRGSERLTLTAIIGRKPIKVSFNIVDMAGVNAAASTQAIVVTYDLMRFARSDDEVAVILGHELAHIVKEHITKGAGLNIFTALLALGAGLFSEAQSPGSGDSVLRGVSQIADLFNRKYSRDLEREADYFGLKYVYYAGYDITAGVEVWERFAIEIPRSMITNFLSTHPSSPERMLRLQKTVEELQQESTTRYVR